MARILLGGLAWLPRRLALALGAATGLLAYALGIRRRITLDNLEIAFPERPRKERRAIARRTYANLGRSAIEALRAPAMGNPDLDALVEVDGFEHLRDALAAGRGVIVATAHFGSWELLGAAMARRGLPLHAIARPIADNAANRALREARAGAGLVEIPDRRSIRPILEVLRGGRVLGVVIDQNMRPPRGDFVPFFGREAATITAPAVLSERTGAPVVTAFAVREPKGRHRVVVRPFTLEWPHEARRANVRHNTRRLNEELERWIRAYPDHWLWLHRRWKTRPPAPR